MTLQNSSGKIWSIAEDRLCKNFYQMLAFLKSLLEKE